MVWAISNISTGSTRPTFELVRHGVIPLLMGVVAVQDEALQTYAIMALGNMACDSPSCQAKLVEHRCHLLLCELVQRAGPSSSVTLYALWALGALMYSRLVPDADARHLLTVVSPLLYDSPTCVSGGAP